MAGRVAPMPVVAANWKMNPTDAGDALDLVRGVLSVARGHADRVDVAIFPPFAKIALVLNNNTPTKMSDFFIS